MSKEADAPEPAASAGPGAAPDATADAARSQRRWLVLFVGLIALTAGCTFQYGLAYLIPTLEAEGFSLRLASLLQVRGPGRLLAAQGVTDESTAVALAQPDAASARAGFRATFASLYLTWNLATALGALGAGRLASPQSLGLDVVGPAAFLALIWPRLRAGWAERGVGAGGALIALGATPLCPPGVPVILAASAALAGALAARPGGGAASRLPGGLAQPPGGPAGGLP